MIISVLLRIVSNPLANVFQKQLTSKGHHPLVVNFYTYVSLSIACIFIALFVRWDQLTSGFWTFSILGGMTGAIGNGFLVKALQTGDLSVLGPVNAYKSVVGIIGGILLLGEIPTIWGITGICLIIYGSYFVLGTTESGFSLSLLKNKEIQYRIYALILTAVEAIFIKKVILASSTTISFISWCCFGTFFSFLLLLVSNVNLVNETKQTIPESLNRYIYLVICIGIMQITTIYTFENMSVGYALSLFQLSILLSVILGHKYFDEKNIVKKIVGSVIMIAGSVIIIFLKDK